MALHPENPTRQSDDYFTILGNQFKLIGFTWNAFRLNFLTFAVIYLLPFILVSAALAAWIPGDIIKADGTLNEPVAREFVENINVNAAVASAIGLTIVGSVLGLANIATQIKSVQGKKFTIADSIEQGWAFLPRMLALTLLVLLVSALWIATIAIPSIGIVMLVLAVIFFALAAFFASLTLYVMVDKNSRPIASLKMSATLVKQNWKIVLAYFVLSMIISIPNTLLGQFGGFISMLLAIAYLCLPALLYLRITRESGGVKTASSAKRQK